MLLGSPKSFHNRTFLDCPSSLATSIRLVPASVQYRLWATQSTAIPMGKMSGMNILLNKLRFTTAINFKIQKHRVLKTLVCNFF